MTIAPPTALPPQASTPELTFSEQNITIKANYQELSDQDVYLFLPLNTYSGFAKANSSNKATLSTNNQSAFSVEKQVIYFATNNRLWEYFPEILKRIKEYFPEAEVNVKLIEDAEEGHQTVFFYIISGLSVKEALSQQIHMFKDWQLIKQEKVNRFVNISIRSYEF